MSKFSRLKGANYERATARYLRDAGIPAERQHQGMRVADAGDVHVDLGDGCTVILECKNYARPTWGLIKSSLEQCHEYVTTEQQICASVVHVPNTSEDIVCMRRSDWVRLTKRGVVNEFCNSEQSGDSEQ